MVITPMPILNRAITLFDKQLDKDVKDKMARWKRHVTRHGAEAPSRFVLKGGTGSGNFGHAGRPGKIGGSGSPLMSDEYVAPKTVVDSKGVKKAPPTTFFRGTDPDRERNVVAGRGDPEWEKNIFVADNMQSAELYGYQINRISAKPGANILYEGTSWYTKVRKASGYKNPNPGYTGGLSEYKAVVRFAQEQGFDAVWFKRQSDVGTVVLNADAFEYERVKEQPVVMKAKRRRTANVNVPQGTFDHEMQQQLLQERLKVFYDQTDALSLSVYTGDITLGQYQEAMKQYIREFHTSAAIIGNGGWDGMTSQAWGRLGTPLREQYKWLNGFMEYIDQNRESISLRYIQNRARLYGEGAVKMAVVSSTPLYIYDLLPWIPKQSIDGKPECLNKCHCKWVSRMVSESGKNWKVYEFIWTLGEAEHCDTCVERAGHTVTLRIPNDVEVPEIIGGF